MLMMIAIFNQLWWYTMFWK